MKVVLSKQATKKLKKLQVSDIKIAKRIQVAIEKLQTGEKSAESLVGSPDFKKTRVGKYRIITTIKENDLLVFIIEKRETVYQTFEHLLNW